VAAIPERRQRWVLAVAGIIVVVFVARLVQVQVLQAPALAAAASAGRMVTIDVAAHRGDITDRNGSVLATSVERYDVGADPRAITKFRGGNRIDAAGSPIADGALGVAQLLAPILGTDQAELAARINGENQYVVLAKNVEPSVQRQIASLGISAYVRTDLVAQRSYPAKALASSILGFTDSDQVGQGGIEQVYNSTLNGTPGKVSYQQGLDGVSIPGTETTVTAAQPGGTVQLTIDSEVQWKAESAINDEVRASGADYGIVVVEDVHTGELLAIADSGNVDPNDRSTDAVAHGSRAVQDIFDPGSTAKVITMAAALQTGTFTPESQFTVPYATTLHGQTFTDSHQHGVEHLTLAGILAESSNSGAVQVADHMPAQVLYDYLSGFGFGQPTGLNLLGESRGILHPVDKWDGRTRYAVAFGQGVSVTALQAVDVFATIAHGGVSVPPVLVRGTSGVDGRLVPAPQTPGTRVISQDTSTTLMHMMEEVTQENGTAQKAQIPGYRVAGKTGTAQIYLNGGSQFVYMSSFIGVAPADNPRYVVGVFLKNPQSSIFGGIVAAPVFKDIMSFVLEKYAVPASAPAPKPFPLAW
jgi:cell division protein FtsI (penicillin-binding protein 3)